MEIDLELDRTFFDLSSKLAEPFCKTFELFRYRLVMPLDQFNCFSLKSQEIACRTSIVAVGCFAAYLLVTMPLPILSGLGLMGVACKVFRALGCYFQKGGFTHVKGSAAEKPVENGLKVMTWNVLGLPGGMHYDHGGTTPWSSRLDGIVQKIEAEDPDVLILQEVFDGALGEALISRLGSRYAHFYTHLGSNVWGSEGGGMVITKCAVDNFSFTSFNNNDWTMNRGFAVLDLKNSSGQPCIRIIGTHFIHGKNQELRNVQMQQIYQSQPFVLPTLIAGDFNTENAWNDHLSHGYKGSGITCTNQLNRHWYPDEHEPEERIDYISAFNGARVTLENGHLVMAFDESLNTKTALSDHHGIALTVNGLSPV